MIRRIVLARSLALPLLLVAQVRVGAQQPAADSAHSLLTALADIHLSGYVETSYSISTHPSDSVIVGRLYDRFNDQFMLNALKISLDKPADSTKLDAGFHTDILFGQNATQIQSAGLELHRTVPTVVQCTLHAESRSEQLQANRVVDRLTGL